MKYFATFEKNVERIFQLQWKIKNISDMFLQYSVLCGLYKNVKCVKCKVYDKKENAYRTDDFDNADVHS